MDLRRSSARPLNQRRSPWQKRYQIFSQLALEAAEKNHVEAGRGFDLKFVWAFIGLSGRSVMRHSGLKSNPPGGLPRARSQTARKKNRLYRRAKHAARRTKILAWTKLLC